MRFDKLKNTNRERIALISCSSRKIQCNNKLKAKDLYSASTLFSLSYEYAKADMADKVYILSDEHGLISDDQELGYYNVSLKNKTNEERKKWTLKVLTEMKEKFDIQNTEFIVLAGQYYCKLLNLEKNLLYKSFPLEHKRIGERLKFLKTEIANIQFVAD